MRAQGRLLCKIQDNECLRFLGPTVLQVKPGQADGNYNTATSRKFV